MPYVSKMKQQEGMPVEVYGEMLVPTWEWEDAPEAVAAGPVIAEMVKAAADTGYTVTVPELKQIVESNPEQAARFVQDPATAIPALRELGVAQPALETLLSTHNTQEATQQNMVNAVGGGNMIPELIQAALSAFGAPIGGAVSGALGIPGWAGSGLVGATGSALSGGNPLIGALTGAGGNFAFDAAGNFIGGAGGGDPYAQAATGADPNWWDQFLRQYGGGPMQYASAGGTTDVPIQWDSGDMAGLGSPDENWPTNQFPAQSGPAPSAPGTPDWYKWVLGGGAALGAAGTSGGGGASSGTSPGGGNVYPPPAGSTAGAGSGTGTGTNNDGSTPTLSQLAQMAGIAGTGLGVANYLGSGENGSGEAGQASDGSGNVTYDDGVSYPASGGTGGTGISGFLQSLGLPKAVADMLGGSLGTAALGGILGGLGANGKPAGVTTTVQDIPEWQKPYVTSLFNQTLQAGNQPQNPLVTSASSAMQDTISGKYLNSNPYLDQIYKHATGLIGAGVDSRFSAAGRYGSGSHVGQLGEQFSGLAGTLYGTDYANERNRMANAAAAAPAFASSAAAAPYAGLTAMGNIIGGKYGGSTSTPYFTNQAGGILSGALAGAALPRLIG